MDPKVIEKLAAEILDAAKAWAKTTPSRWDDLGVFAIEKILLDAGFLRYLIEHLLAKGYTTQEVVSQLSSGPMLTLYIPAA